MVIHRFDSLESTNQYCELLDLSSVEEFSVFWALEQTAGRGQRGNHWNSQPGKNLTFSLILHPIGLPVARQFCLTQVLSLGVSDYLKATFDDLGLHHLAQHVSIKWPNDIYVGTRKICGILVENRISGLQMATAVCGIGLNVNQIDFPDWAPNPTSMKLLTECDFKLEPSLQQLLSAIEQRYKMLATYPEQIEQDYLHCMLRRGMVANYAYDGKNIEAMIQGVTPEGRLILMESKDNTLICDLKQIQFLF